MSCASRGSVCCSQRRDAMRWRDGESQARKVKRDLISRHESVEALLGLCWGGEEGRVKFTSCSGPEGEGDGGYPCCGGGGGGWGGCGLVSALRMPCRVRFWVYGDV